MRPARPPDPNARPIAHGQDAPSFFFTQISNVETRRAGAVAASSGRLGQDQPTFADQEIDNLGHPCPVPQLRHDQGPGSARRARIPFQKRGIDADMGGQIGLVHHQQVGSGQPGPRLRGMSCPAAVSMT
jgi:hypothetical protein